MLTIISLLFGVSSYADIYQMTALTDERFSVHAEVAPPKAVIKVSYENKKKTFHRAVPPKTIVKNEKLHSIVEEKAKKHDVDPNLVRAVIRVESNWAPGAVSHKGAVGIMQLMPNTANAMGVRNRYNPEENIDGGVKYLHYLLEKFNGNITLALAAYNAGPTRVEKNRGKSTNPKTVSYVKRVMAYYYSSKPVYSESRKPSAMEGRKPKTIELRKEVVVVAIAVVDDDKAILANLGRITAINN
jgi:membrane-bound lytic murein transglycosylase MltF